MMTKTFMKPLLFAVWAMFLAMQPMQSACAQSFSVIISPPRFEDRAKAGEVYRNVLEISNTDAQPASFTLKTNDWSLNKDGSVSYSDGLDSGSCRQWVALETRQLTVAPNGKKRFRFEVAVPANTPAGECRFAILVEGLPQKPTNSKVPLAVSGRIGVIVYLTIGDAAPKLAVVGAGATVVEGRTVPSIEVKNTGNAHGRMEGFIDGVDNSGKKLTFLPSNLPILAGETRTITLEPQGDEPGVAGPVLQFPVKIKGALDWGRERTPIEAAFDPE